MGLQSALFYGVCSGSMSFFNKIALTTYKFNYPNVMLLAQMLTTVFILKTLMIMRRISIPGYSFDVAISCLLPSIFYSFHATFALSALSEMNIPMYNVMKRCVALVTVLMGAILLNKGLPRLRIVASVVLITAGCIIAGYGDLDFSPQAYTSGIICVCSQAMYLTLVQKLGLEKYSAHSILYYNSINSIPLLLMYVVFTEEHKGALKFLNTATIGFYCVLIPVLCMGCVLNYSMFLCTTSNSALTTTIVGITKGVITTIIGMFTFGGVKVTVVNLSGILINIFGAVWYAYERYLERKTINKDASSV